MTFTLREMNSLDLPVVVSMERDIYRNDAWSVGQFKEELANVPKNRLYLVAQDEENSVIGYAGVFAPNEGLDAEVLTLTVSGEFRRKGIGRSLLRKLIAWALERNSPSIFLEVREGNDEASPLYVSEGFEPISHRNNYYSAGVRAVVMKKDLS
jgi:ribosomal-protein-alanine N-acetyltransferase